MMPPHESRESDRPARNGPSAGFDPYHSWLAIPPEEQPANHYRLLGVSLFECDRDVIRNAADQRMTYLKTFGAGQHSRLSQTLLNEVSAAKVCLLNEPKKRAYDEQLRKQTAPSSAARPAPVPQRPPAGSQTRGDSMLPRVVVDDRPSVDPRKKRRPFARKEWAIGAVAMVLLFIVGGSMIDWDKPDEPSDSLSDTQGPESGESEEKEATGREEPDITERYALRFNGKDSFLQVPSLFYDGSHPITAEAIVTPDVILKTRSAVVLGTTEIAGFDVGYSNQGWKFTMHNGRQYVHARSDTPPLPNQRTHLAGVFDGNQLFLFVDGKKQSSAPFLGGAFKASRFPITIGASPSANSPCDCPFKGDVEQIRISRTVRYSADFEPPSEFTADDDTILLLQFEEGEGPIVCDTSGNNHTGVIHGAEWIVIPNASLDESKTSEDL